MATRGKGLRDFLKDNRDDRGRDDDDEPRGRGRGRDDDEEEEPESERRPAARSSRRDDDRDPPRRSSSRDDDRPARRSRDDDDDDKPRNSRRNHTPRKGRFTGVPSAEARPPQLEEGKHLLRIVKTFESENPKTGTWFQIHVEVLDSDNKKYRAGDAVSLRYHTERKSMTVTGPKITGFVRSACGFKSDDEMRKRVPKMSESGRAGYDVLIDAALGEQDAEDEFGKNPLQDRVLLTDASKGKYDEDRDIQYFEFEWSACDQKQEKLDEGEERPSRGTERRASRRAAPREEERPASRSSRGRGREEPDEDEEEEEREEERPRARSRR